MRSEVLELKSTDDGAQATIRLVLGKTDLGVIDSLISIASVEEPFEDAEVRQLAAELIRSAVIGGWAAFSAYALAKNLDAFRAHPNFQARLGPDDVLHFHE